MWDALVVGGGPAGCAAALALRARGARVLVAQRAGSERESPGESLVGEAVACLHELGLGAEFRALDARPCHLHRIHWAEQALERPALATSFGPTLHVDRRAFDALLLRACELRGVAVKRGASLLRLDCARERAVVELNDAGTVLRTECAAIVDATGRSAWVCRRLQATRERVDRLVALVANFERGDTEPSSLVESGPDGWWYSAPRPRGLLVTMYLTELFGPGERNRELMFSTALEQAPATRRRAAGRARTTDVCAHRAGPEWTCFDPELPVLPVGDAALSFDPISGEGICFALRSGMEAAKALGSAALRRAYRDGARGIYEQHLREREVAYALERRQRSTPFWMRPRGEPSSPLGGAVRDSA